MPHQVRMTIDERYTYLRICQDRCKTTDRRRRSSMLDEMEHITNLDRKILIRHMRRRRIERHRRCRQRSQTHDAAPVGVSRLLYWDAANALWKTASVAFCSDCPSPCSRSTPTTAVSSSSSSRSERQLLSACPAPRREDSTPQPGGRDHLSPSPWASSDPVPETLRYPCPFCRPAGRSPTTL